MSMNQSDLPLATALRQTLSKGYGFPQLRADLLSGLVVGIVALPLSMALAIAVGVPPQHGLYTAIFAGFSVALLGGCKFQVTGPTAAFIVILAPIVAKHGLSGLLTAGFMAGLILVGLGVARLGSLIRFIPYPVTTGFTTGIATVIATLQIKDLLGLQIPAMPEHFHEKVLALWSARGTVSLFELGLGLFSFALLLLVPKVQKKIPAPLVAIVCASIVAAVLSKFFPGHPVATIGSRFHSIVNGVKVAGIPSVFPVPALPFGPNGLSFELVQTLLPSALAIALLGAIESLLSAVIADGMTRTKHDPNAELVGLGIGNILSPLFSGIAATGALARTATNIRVGAVSPLSAAFHAVVVLLAMLVLAPLFSYVPMASLAAVLLLVAWNMSELPHFIGLLRISPKSDVSVLLTCYGLTVFFDMVVAVSVGFVLAAILFMRRMAEITQTRGFLDNTAEAAARPLPKGVILYEINGPLFFGAAQNALDAMHASHGDTFLVLVLSLEHVPVIDATGFAALENAIEVLGHRNKRVVIAGPLPRPQSIFERAKLEERHKNLRIAPNLDQAVELAGALAGELAGSSKLTSGSGGR